MQRHRATSFLLGSLLVSCAHVLTPAQDELRRQGDCVVLLRAADEQRVLDRPEAARVLASGCSQQKLDALVASAPGPADALLLCGRARATLGGEAEHPLCNAHKVSDLLQALHPRITLGPPDPEPAPEPLLGTALADLGPQLNLAFDGEDPMVIVGRLLVTVDHQTTSTFVTVPDGQGTRRSVPATQHRLVARCEGQVELLGKTRTLRAIEEARDATWQGIPRLGIAAKPAPDVPDEEELKRRVTRSWLGNLARALANAPPEAVEADDATGCLAYGLALAAVTGDRDAAAHGGGEPDRVAACEKILGLPRGAGIPVP